MRTVTNILSFASIVLFVVPCFAGEIVLQNGKNGYTGCVDTYLSSIGDSIVFPFEQQNTNFYTGIIVKTANCQS